MTLDLFFVVIRPSFNVVQTDCHAHFVVSSCAADSMPECVIVFSVEKYHKVKLNIDPPG